MGEHALSPLWGRKERRYDRVEVQGAYSWEGHAPLSILAYRAPCFHVGPGEAGRLLAAVPEALVASGTRLPAWSAQDWERART